MTTKNPKPTDEQIRAAQQILADYVDHLDDGATAMDPKTGDKLLAFVRDVSTTDRVGGGNVSHSLDDAYDEIVVDGPGTFEGPGPWDTSEHAIHHTWWAVSDGNRTLAFFASERHAFRFRLDLINRRLNG